MIETSDAGPSLRAAPFGPGGCDVVQLLSPDQRSQIADIATAVAIPPGKIVYREGADAESVFIIADGVVKTFRDLPSGKRRVMAFLFADDVFGLAQCGHYVYSVQTVTPAKLYRVELATLIETLRRNGDLAFQFLCKVTHELRAALLHNVIMARRDAVGRLAMFLHMLEQNARSRENARIEIPMSRSDVANYLGLSLESVSRAMTRLERTQVISFQGRHQVQVADRARFEKIASTL